MIMGPVTSKNLRPGVAILVVLFVIMVATIISLSFIAKSDVELACGQNVGPVIMPCR